MKTITRIHVLVYPAEGLPHIAYLENINISPIPPTILGPIHRISPSDSQAPIHVSHLTNDSDEHLDRSASAPRSNARLQEWDAHAWARPRVHRTATYHLLYTAEKGEELLPNDWSGGEAWGNMYLLRLSDSGVSDGHRFYEDMDPDEAELEHWQFMSELLAARLNAL